MRVARKLASFSIKTQKMWIKVTAASNDLLSYVDNLAHSKLKLRIVAIVNRYET